MCYLTVHDYSELHACVCAQSLSCVQLFMTPWTGACQAPLSMGFSRQEYWSGFPFLTPRDLPNPGIKSVSPIWAGEFSTIELQGTALGLP